MRLRATRRASTSASAVALAVNPDITAFPAGAMGIWLAKNYSTTPRKHVPNSMAAAPLSSANWFAIETNGYSFNGDEYFSTSGTTITRRYSTGPVSGIQSAFRVVSAAAANGNMPVVPTLSVGTWTMAMWAKATSATTDIRFGPQALYGGPATKTLTTSWQRITHTFTVTSAGNVALQYAWDIPALPGFDIQIDNVGLFAGSSDLGANAATVGHLLLDRWPNGATTYPATGVLNLTGGGSGVMQFPATAISQFTIGAMVKRVSSSDSGYMAIMSSPTLGYGVFTQYLSNGALKPNAAFGAGISLPGTGQGLWDLNGNDWHMITHRYDGANYTIWYDDHILLRSTLAPSTRTIDTLLAFTLNGFGAFSTSHQMSSMFMYPTALSDATIRGDLLTAVRTRATTDGVTLPSVRRFVSAEGDSITALGQGYYAAYAPNAAKPVAGINFAVSGSAITDLVSRGATVDLGYRAGATNILTVLIGANDLGGYAGGESAWFAALMSYVSARRSVGWKVGVCTVLPKNDATHNTRRNIVNPQIRSAVGTQIDFVIDFDTDAQMGIDNSFTAFPANWTDGTHPNATGHARLEPIYRAAVNAVT